ncbi:MAG: dTDP-4-dehydrorhamnose reductase [Gallionella sp.]
MKILLFGKNGQVGWELQRSLAPLGELVAVGRDSRELCGDLAKLDAIADTIRLVAPDIIVNAAAHTAVDKAESEPELAHTLNAMAPEVLAHGAKQTGALLIHYSTDYVFDGSGELPWRETDATGPLGVYGSTKLEGEQRIGQSGCKHLIFRTSWVYAARGGNFAKTMLRLARERDSLNVIDDQFGAPTGADLLADVTAHAIRATGQQTDLSGIYHLVSSGVTSWCDYAKFVIDYARQSGEQIRVAPGSINSVATSAYPTPAKRPLNSRLNTDKLKHTFDLHLPPWQAGVMRMLGEVMENAK